MDTRQRVICRYRMSSFFVGRGMNKATHAIKTTKAMSKYRRRDTQLYTEEYVSVFPARPDFEIRIIDTIQFSSVFSQNKEYNLTCLHPVVVAVWIVHSASIFGMCLPSRVLPSEPSHRPKRFSVSPAPRYNDS